MSLLVFPLLAQEIQVIKFPELQKMIGEKDEGIKVINFWATWCKPCVEELGYFEELTEQYAGEKVQVILVSFDFVEDLETRVARFVQKKQLKSKVVLLDETDYDSFINKISPEWSGAIPATLFVNTDTGKKEFYEKQFKKGELQTAVQSFMKNQTK